MRASRVGSSGAFPGTAIERLWHFDTSPSDLKHVEAPLWIERGRGKPTPMRLSVVDDRSGVVYEDYRCVYGEDVNRRFASCSTPLTPSPSPMAIVDRG